MQLLFDTHVLLALMRETLMERYPDVSGLLADSIERRASVVSLWEISIKARLGKLDPGVPPEDRAAFLERAGFRILDMDRHHAVAAVDPEPATRDPFDRMPLAQCAAEGLRLVTFDRALAVHPLAYAGSTGG